MPAKRTKTVAWLSESHGFACDRDYFKAIFACPGQVPHHKTGAFSQACNIVDPLAPQALRNALGGIIRRSKTGARTRQGGLEFALRAVTDNRKFAIERALLEQMA